MGVLSNIEPKEVFKHFEALSMVPRRSFRNEKISAFCVQFAKDHGLDYVQDEMGNVVIYKPGTAGYENSEPVILQGHMDMVAAKTTESDHDFDNDPLDLFVDGENIGARDTTLGADDGFALAYAMAILESTDIPHPPIEAVFTVDEEVGMMGAAGLDASLLKGRKVMNLDGEDEGLFTVGCAGAHICDVVIPVRKAETQGTPVTIRIRDYQGGHSGNEIDKQHGNAHKDMARMLYTLSKDFGFKVASVDGGSGANVIAKFCTAVVIVEDGKARELCDKVSEMAGILEEEYSGQEPDMKITSECGEDGKYAALDADSNTRVIRYLYGAPDGVQCMERTIEGAVESSLNTGVVATEDSAVRVSYQMRSSIASKLDEMLDRIRLWSEIVGADIEMIGSFPAWAYNPVSELRPLMVRVYKDLYGEEPVCAVMHCRLEGGIFVDKNPEFDIVTFGPNLRGVHTPDERLNIPSFVRTWDFLKAILKECK